VTAGRPGVTAAAVRRRIVQDDGMPRLDVLLCERGLSDSRSRAQALIMAGAVRVDGHVVTKAGTAVGDGALLEVAEPPRYVSRGGDKLATALDAFGVDPAGLRCLDVGASTGGFSDCLLQRGAAAVVALDVGRGQLHERIARDPRVVRLDRVNARELDPARLPYAPALCVADVSFISLELVLPPIAACLARPGCAIVLVKPQFEAGREHARRGVVRDPAVRLETLRAVAAAAGRSGLVTAGACDSGHPGPAGNRELFLLLVTPDHPAAVTAPADPEELLRAAAGV
jgi:23S rRNA (cytidine1920-2'-O)/16S rRNA (cytidine1409-2'-O)-methyltransferase